MEAEYGSMSLCWGRMSFDSRWLRIKRILGELGKNQGKAMEDEEVKPYGELQEIYSKN